MSSGGGDDRKRAAPGTLVVHKDGARGWVDEDGVIRYEDGTAGWLDDNQRNLPPSPSKEVMLDRAREERDYLLANESWYTSEQVAKRSTDELAGLSSEEYTKLLRSERRLLGVRFRGEYLHPASQFLPSGEVHPAMLDVLTLLPHSDANWAAAFWWFQPTGLLLERGISGEWEARRPADVFLADPQRVVAAAKSDFVRRDSEF